MGNVPGDPTLAAFPAVTKYRGVDVCVGVCVGVPVCEAVCVGVPVMLGV